MVCPESANFFYGEYGEYGVSRASMSNPEKPGFSFCFSIQVRSCLTRPPYSPYSLYPPFQFAKRNFFIPNSSDAIRGNIKTLKFADICPAHHVFR